MTTTQRTKIGVLLGTRGLVMKAQREGRPADADVMLDLAERAGLVIAAPRAWTVADEAAAWLESPRLDRWRILAAA